MLILKVYVNTELIDEIHIQNTGRCDDMNRCKYAIRKPKVNRKRILHHRPSGWMPLVRKVLECLEGIGIKTSK